MNSNQNHLLNFTVQKLAALPRAMVCSLGALSPHDNTNTTNNAYKASTNLEPASGMMTSPLKLGLISRIPMDLLPSSNSSTSSKRLVA
jgi:hypothetical protein